MRSVDPVAVLFERRPGRVSRRVVAQGHPLQCAEGITRCECTRRAVISESIGIPSQL
jgi:hypothetical protein